MGTVNRISLPPVAVVVSPLIPWLLWNLWTARNKLVFERKIYGVEEVISKAVIEARAWEEANAPRKKPLQPQRPPKSGRPTCRNVWLCWCDGAWREESKFGGMGWIIKNEDGEVICRGSANRPFVSSALVAEALAIKEALRKAISLEVQRLHVFLDCQVLISALREGQDMNEVAGILLDIRNLATLFCHLSFSFIPKIENSQADLLVSAGLAKPVVIT